MPCASTHLKDTTYRGSGRAILKSFAGEKQRWSGFWDAGSRGRADSGRGVFRLAGRVRVRLAVFDLPVAAVQGEQFRRAGPLRPQGRDAEGGLRRGPPDAHDMPFAHDTERLRRRPASPQPQDPGSSNPPSASAAPRRSGHTQTAFGRPCSRQLPESRAKPRVSPTAVQPAARQQVPSNCAGSTKVSANRIGCPRSASMPDDGRRRERPRTRDARFGTRNPGKTKERVLQAIRCRRRNCCSRAQPIQRSRTPTLKARATSPAAPPTRRPGTPPHAAAPPRTDCGTPSSGAPP